MADRCFVFFFFKQKTAYDMRISDWSSDVCSSDLACSGASQTSAQGSSPSGGETSEPLRRAEPDDARVEREDVGAEQGVVAVGEGVGDGCLVEDILDIELQREIIRRPRERNREVEIVPSFQSIIFGIVDARKALRLTVIIAAEGQFPIATVDEGGILRAQIEGQPGRVGQFIADKVSKKAAPAIRRAADLAAPRIGIRLIIGHQRSDSIGIIWRKGNVSEAISLCQIAERSEEHTYELQYLMR